MHFHFEKENNKKKIKASKVYFYVYSFVKKDEFLFHTIQEIKTGNTNTQLNCVEVFFLFVGWRNEWWLM